MDCSLLGSSVHGILQARILEWVVLLCKIQDLTDPRIEPGFPALQADSLLSEPPGKPGYLQSVQSLSCPTLCDPMNRSTPGLPVHHKLREFTQIQVH